MMLSNVLTDITLMIMLDKMHNECSLQDCTVVFVDDILDLLKLCLEQTIFQFKGKMYKGADGCPMDSSIPMT